MFSKFVNRMKMIGSYYRGHLKGLPFPQEVVLELTNHCNLQCTMCPHSEMKRPKGFMKKELFEGIIDQIKGHAELVYLHGTGESLLHKELEDYIQYASNAGLVTLLSTNGLPVNETNARSILNCDLDYLLIAMDGGAKETYEKIRIGGDFDKLVSNIKQLLKLRNEMGSKTKIQLQMIMMPENKYEIESFRACFTPKEQREISQFRYKPVFEGYVGGIDGIEHTRPCYWLWNMMSIAWDGRVQLCCMDYDVNVIEADTNERLLIDIWNDPQFQTYRQKHLDIDYSSMLMCERCSIPEEGYFSNPNILASGLISAGNMRKLLPLYEKFVLAKD